MTGLILFDLDGTLLDHRGALLTAIRDLIARFGVAGGPAEELVSTWWSLERRHMGDYLAGRCSFEEQRRRRLREFLPLLGEPVPGDRAGLDAWFAEEYLAGYTAGLRDYPDAAPCLASLAGTGSRLAVFTNGERRQQRAKLHRFGMLAHFEDVVTPADVGTAKPDPDCLVRACRRLGVAPAEAVYVGDWLEGDAIAAARGGLRGIWLDRGVHAMTGEATTQDEGAGEPITRITTLHDLPSALR